MGQIFWDIFREYGKRIMVLVVVYVFATMLPAGAANRTLEGDEFTVAQEGGTVVFFKPQDASYIQGLSGDSLIDVTVCFFRQTGERFSLLPVGLPEQRDCLAGVRELSIRYIFRPAKDDGKPAACFVLEQMAKDDIGNIVWQESAEALTAQSTWPMVAAVEEKILAGVLASPGLHTVETGAADRRLWNSCPFQDLNEGFMGLAWGTEPDKIPGLVPYEQSPQGVLLYKASLPGLTRFRVSLADSPVASSIPGAITLVFLPGEGLVQGYITFKGSKGSAAEMGLLKFLGAPVMIEPINSRGPVPTTWFTGSNTRVEIREAINTVVVFSRRDLAYIGQ